LRNGVDQAFSLALDLCGAAFQRVADLYGEDERQYRLRELEKGLGKELADDDIVKRVEFVETYARKIGRDDII
jgi:hypothetical protein